MKVYVTRDKYDDDDNMVDIWLSKPKKYEDKTERKIYIEYESNDGFSFLEQDYRTFKKRFGFIPEKGSCELVDLNIRRSKK